MPFRTKPLAEIMVLVTLMAMLSSWSSAQEIDEIIVLGSKLELAVSHMTQAVSVIDEAELDAFGYMTLTEVLRHEAGLEFSMAGVSGQFNYPKMRGFASGHMLVVLDKVKLNDASSGNVGNILGQIDPDSIERVEILRGPQATLYGSNSTAGVISINTKSGQAEELRVSLESGSLAWRSLGVAARGNTDLGKNSLLYSFTYDSSDADGVNDYEYTENQTLQLKLQFQADNISFGGSFWQTDNQFAYAELNENYAKLKDRTEHWAFQTGDPNQVSETLERVSTLFVGQKINEHWRHKFTLGYDDKTYQTEDLNDGELGFITAPFDNFFDFSCDYSSIYNAGDQVPVCDSLYVASVADTNLEADYNLIYADERLDFLVGLEYFKQKTLSESNFSRYQGKHSVNSIYINSNIRILAEQGILSLGLRYDDYDSWGSHITGSLGAAYDLSPNLNIFANYGSSFNAPSTNNLFSATGNSDLNPEQGETFEVGIRSNLNAWSANMTYWHTDLDNVIAFDGSIPNPDSPFGYGLYINRDNQLSQGAELIVNYQFNEQLSLRTNYTYTDSKGKQGELTFRTVQVADHKGNIGLQYRARKLMLGVNAYYSGPRLRWNGDVEMNSYTRIDINGSYSFSDSLRLYSRVENLFDTNIEEALGYKQAGVYGVIGLEYKM